MSLLEPKFLQPILQTTFRYISSYRFNPIEGVYCFQFNINNISVDFYDCSETNNEDYSFKESINLTLTPYEVFTTNRICEYQYFDTLLATSATTDYSYNGHRTNDSVYRVLAFLRAVYMSLDRYVTTNEFGYLQITPRDISNTSVTMYYKPILTPIDLEKLIIGS